MHSKFDSTRIRTYDLDSFCSWLYLQQIILCFHIDAVFYCCNKLTKINESRLLQSPVTVSNRPRRKPDRQTVGTDVAKVKLMVR